MAFEKFHFKLTTDYDADGDPIKENLTLPKFGQIKFGLVRKNRKLPQHEQFFALLEEICSDEQLDLIDRATQESMGELFEAWQKDSGVTAGESTAS